MILLDTNVISELMKPRPEARVESWLRAQPAVECYISAVTEAELRYGIEVLPLGQRRTQLLLALVQMLNEDFHSRILPFGSLAAVAFARIAADRRRAGHPISQLDAQIAAIVYSKGATLASRNIIDFQGCGIAIIDPWNS